MVRKNIVGIYYAVYNIYKNKLHLLVYRLESDTCIPGCIATLITVIFNNNVNCHKNKNYTYQTKNN